MRIEDSYEIYDLPDFIILYPLAIIETRIFITDTNFDASKYDKYTSEAYYRLIDMGLTNNRLTLYMNKQQSMWR